MISKEDFQNQVAATQTPEELITLIKITSRDIGKEELLAQIYAAESAMNIVELIERVDNFMDDEVAYVFFKKIKHFISSTTNHQEFLLLKMYFINPDSCPIGFWSQKQYLYLKLEITCQLMRTCDSRSELKKIFHNSPNDHPLFSQIISVYYERLDYLK